VTTTQTSTPRRARATSRALSAESERRPGRAADGPVVVGDDLPWSDWALLPAALDLLLAEVDRGRRRIIECGSGVSTIALARALRKQAGRIGALEHDPGWAAFVVAWLEREGLDGIATVVEAPLRAHPLALDGTEWYDQSALERLPRSDIELLLVDGPPAGEPGLDRARYPALPVLSDRLAKDAIVVLDDVNRPGEAEVLAAWERETPFRFERLDYERIAIGRREPPAGSAARGSGMGRTP
jgi:predicted O-methyltransferase YrrM